MEHPPSVNASGATVRRLPPGDLASCRALLAMFGRAFEDPALYSKLGIREDVMHFDIDVSASPVDS